MANFPTLKAKLIDLIHKQGPLTIADYMEACLNDEDFGYYQKQQPFGQKGDFITAPEISQMFGEIISIWIIHAYQSYGYKAEFLLCEMGPGRGTLMKDILSCLKKLAPDIFARAKILLVESSPSLQKIQAKVLKDFSINFAQKLESFEKMPLFFIANELLDALPIRQFCCQNNQFFEIVVNCTENGQELIFTQQKAETSFVKQLTSYPLFTKKAEGKFFEISPARFTLIKNLTIHLRQFGGAALFFDYGNLLPSWGNTLQTIHKHRYTNPLENPGRDDITAHVDFYSLALVAQKQRCYSFGLEQGEFLLKLGLATRAQQLAFQKPLAIQQKIEQDMHRLSHPKEMGQLFKTMLITPQAVGIFPFDRPIITKELAI